MNPQGSSSVCVVPTSTGKDLVTSKLSLECNVCGKKWPLLAHLMASVPNVQIRVLCMFRTS